MSDDRDKVGRYRYIGLIVAVAVVVFAILYDFNWWGDFNFR